MSNIRRATVKQLAYKIKSTGKANPRFAFFLGAGASRQSGIITASEMIRFFRQQIIEQECPDSLKMDAEKEKWLSEQEWYRCDGSEYCKCFERYEPKEMGRQRYIESIIEGHKPSFGYVVLANLIAQNYINTLITTNFDDLMYSACSTFTDIRPIVFAYGVLASEMRVAVPRPKILKLHGDYLYSMLKNTRPELETQDPNMARQVLQVLNEYSLVMVGYAGNDKSVMDILAQISEKNDLYWCVRREEPNADVIKLLSDKGGFLIEIAGFDEMMNEIRSIVGFNVQAMLGSMQSRQDLMIEQLKGYAPQNNLADVLREIADVLHAQAEQQQAQSHKNRALQFFAQGLATHESGKLNEAETAYRQAIEFDPSLTQAYNNLGWLIAKDPTRVAEAEKLYRKVITIAPNDAAAYNNLGILLATNLARATDAEAAYRKAIEIDPRYALAYKNLGNLLYKLGRYEEAEAAYYNAITIEPDDADIYYNLGILLNYLRRSSEAETAYRKAITLNPNFALTYNNLGILLSNLQRIDEAEATYRKAIELNPHDATAYNNLALLLDEQLTRLSEAEAAYYKAVELDPNDGTTYYNLGNLLAKDATRTSEVEAAYRKAVELDPNLTSAISNLAYLLRTQNRFEEAELLYRRAIELEHENPRRYTVLVLLLRQQGRESEAIPLAEKQSQLDPQDFDPLLALASMHKHLGHDGESATYAAQARALIPTDDWYNLACLESVCGNVDAAIEHLQRAAQDSDFDRDWARRDPDLERIRDDPRFKGIVGEDTAGLTTNG